MEDEVELADITKERVQHLDEQVYCLEISELVVVCIDTYAKEETGIPPVDNLVVAVLSLWSGGKERKQMYVCGHWSAIVAAICAVLCGADTGPCLLRLLAAKLQPPTSTKLLWYF